MSFALPFVWLFLLACVSAQNVSNATTTSFARSSAILNLNSTTSNSSAIHSITEQASRNATLIFNTTSTISISGSPQASNTSSIDPVLACDRQWASYSRSSLAAYKPVSKSTVTKVIVSTETVYQTTYTCSSTCGNVCYADVTTTASSVSTTVSTDVSISTKWATYTGPQPSCTVPSASCSSIWQVWSQSTSVWNTWYNNMGPPDQEPPWPYATPGCKWCSQTNCFIQGSGKVQIYYWPQPTTVSRDMCTDFPTEGPFDATRNYVNTSYTPVTTGASVVLDGRTFYEGNVYLSIPAASVTDNCGATLGKVHTDIMLTLASTDIHTGRNDNLSQGGVYSINYADFNSPVPWSAYKGALRDCATGMNFGMGPWCTRSVVFQDQFHPVVDMPYSLQHLDPAWASCKPIVMLIDPPVALSTANMFASVKNPPIVLSPVTFLASQTITTPKITPQPQPAGSPPAVVIETKYPDPDPGRGDANESRPKPTGTPSSDDNEKGRVPGITVGPTVLPVDASRGAVIIPGSTITRDGPEAVIDGTTVRIEGNQATLESPSGVSQIPLVGEGSTANGAGVSIGNQMLTVDSKGNLVASAMTLIPGAPAVTIADSVLSVGPNGITIMNASTGKIQSIAFSDLQNSNVITAGDQIMTVDAAGNLVLASGQTLHIGDPAITIGGTVLSVGTAGVIIVDQNGNTRTVATADGTSTGGNTLEDMQTEAVSQAQEQTSEPSPLPTSSKKGGAQRTKPHHYLMSIGSLAIVGLLCFVI